ncbi:Omp28-related outer membrane protein [Planctomycetota bacterium]
MKKLSTLLSAIAILASITAGTNAQIKNVLLEQHTGAWCGWCVDGTVVMDEILELYGDQVIGVKIHSGDAMEIPEQSVIAGALGLSGYPTGSIDRKDFGGSVFLNRGSWKASCESQMQQKAKAEVDCFYTLDKDTRIVKIQVMANIVEPMDFPLKFNAYIVEDDVTGVGSGYDQKNYLSGRAGFEDNPYYDQPSTIVGYHHMKVVRKMLGGAWGVAFDIPETVQAGEFYCYQFVSEIDEAWKIDDLYFVGMLQADAEDNKEIINCAYAIEDVLLFDSNTPAKQAVPTVSDFNNVYTLINPTDEDQTYTVTVSTTGRTPADWSAEFSCGTTELTTADINDTSGQIVVPANSSVELLLTLKVGSTLGFGDAKIVLVLEDTPTVKRTRMITAVTSEFEKLLLETGSGYSIRPYLDHTDHNDLFALDLDDYLAFADKMTNVKLIIWNKGPSGRLSLDELDIIKNTEDVNHFICGDSVVYSLAYSNNLSYFGLEWIGWNIEAQGSTGTVWLSGQQGDVITGNLGENIEGHLIQYYIDMVRITDTENVFPIMHFQNNGTREYNNFRYSIVADDAIFGIRTAKNNARTVLLGITPYIIADENVRQTLIMNILDWLVGDTGAENLK